MRNSQIILVAFCALFISACAASKLSTVWKTEQLISLPNNRIMVAGILEKNDDSLRTTLENEWVSLLSTLGYHAVSSVQSYGPNRFMNLDDEAAYTVLCDNGIDAVLTCALVDESYAKALDYGSNMRYTSAYYYMRLRNYRKLQADRAINGLNNNSMYRWEIILFDLNTLQTRCVMQTKSFSMNDARMAITSVPAQAIKRMLDEKVIQKQLVPAAAKPF